MKLIKNKLTETTLKVLKNLQDKANKNRKDDNEKIYSVYLAGGMGVNFYTDERPSFDIDMECSRDLAHYLDDDIVEKISENVLYVDKNYNSALSLLHEDYIQNSIPLEEIPFSEYDKIKIKPYVLSALDIAISKIDRFSLNDQTDIKNMYNKNLFTIEELETKANEAIKYYIGDDRFVKINLKETIDMLKEEDLNKKIEQKNNFIKDYLTFKNKKEI